MSSTEATAEAKVPSPGDNFYLHVNSKWLNDPANAIPAEYSTWGGFTKLHDDGLKKQIALVSQLDIKSKDEKERKIALLWSKAKSKFQAWADDVKEGDYSPLLSELEHLQKTVGNDLNLDAIARYVAYCNLNGLSTVMNFDKGADLKNSNNVKLDLAPSGLSLPSRDFYFEDKYSKQLGWFKDHLANVEKLAKSNGITLAESFVDKVLAFEKKLANISMKREHSRDYDKYFTNTTLKDFYGKITELNAHPDKQAQYTEAESKVACDSALIGQFMETIYKELDLRPTLQANYKEDYPQGTEDVETLVAFDGDFFRRLFPLLLDKANLPEFTAWCQYKAASFVQAYCTKELNEEFFDFYSRKLGGQQGQKPVEKRALAVVDSWLSELLGEMFVRHYFSEEDKLKVVSMIDAVLTVMKKSLTENDWLTQSTKEKALAKLSKFSVKIGFPDEWKDYSTLDLLETDSLYQMRKKVIAFSYRKEFLEKINKLVDRKEWHMSPQTVNAYFHPQHNEIVFPAAILQPPFYHKSEATIDFEVPADVQKTCEEYGIDKVTAANFGAIGAVIAHEITHGYDDQGCKFDGEGNLVDWWTEEDRSLFKAKTELMERQANRYTYVEKTEEPGKEDVVHKMNAHLCMGENLADLGGMTLALRGLLVMNPPLPSESPAATAARQRALQVVFFTSFANIWKMNMSKESRINRLATDPHAPVDFRGNMVANIDEFYSAFGVKEGSPMYIKSEERVRMW